MRYNKGWPRLRLIPRLFFFTVINVALSIDFAVVENILVVLCQLKIPKEKFVHFVECVFHKPVIAARKRQTDAPIFHVLLEPTLRHTETHFANFINQTLHDVAFVFERPRVSKDQIDLSHANIKI